MSNNKEILLTFDQFKHIFRNRTKNMKKPIATTHHPEHTVAEFVNYNRIHGDIIVIGSRVGLTISAVGTIRDETERVEFYMDAPMINGAPIDTIVFAFARLIPKCGFWVPLGGYQDGKIVGDGSGLYVPYPGISTH